MPSAASYTINDYESLLVALQNVLGVVVPEGQRMSFVERISPVLASHQMETMATLAECLQDDDSDEIKSNVLDVISQAESNWVVSPDMKHILHDYVFEQLPDNARIWLVGCAQGQLAYALAMEIAEYANKTNTEKKLQVIATDSSSENIEQAKQASYSEEQLLSLSAEYKKLYMAQTNTGGRYQLKERVRQLVDFSQCDLTDDFQNLAPMDLILSPDALVYFSNEMKANIIQQFSSVLKSGGIFLTGSNQTILPITDGFERVNHSAGIFYRQLG